MANLTTNDIFTKIEFPPSGFILQKDVYTTNLLYANDQFPLKALKKRLPFRPQKMQNPCHSVRILRENGNISERSKTKQLFYLQNNFKPKKLILKKLKFPLPKTKIFPLTCLNLNEKINKKDVKIKNMDDDLNITSNTGRKIIYRYKENKLSNDQKPNFPILFRRRKQKNNKNFNNNKSNTKREKDKIMDKISLRHIVSQLNDELKNIRQIEKDRKRSFIRDKFFSTQIYAGNICEYNYPYI